MSYKCPYCLYKFRQEQAIPEQVSDEMHLFRCPNPALFQNTERLVCGRRLPLNYFDSSSIVIALTGAMRVGKTYYYLALLSQLKYNRTLHKLGISGDAVGEKNTVNKINVLIEQVYRKQMLLPTLAGEENDSLLIHLTITGRKGTNHVYLSFFDNPGERFTDIDYMIDNFSNVYRADGLIFLIEPKQIPHLWNSILKTNPYLRNDVIEPIDLYPVMDNVIQLLKHVKRHQDRVSEQVRQPNSQFGRRWLDAIQHAAGYIKNNNLTADNKVKTPFAIAISKFDQLRQSTQMTIPYDATDFEIICIKDNKLDMELVTAMSNEIEDLITGGYNGEERIKNLLVANLKKYSFFGVKSVDVDDAGMPTTLNPQGVLLPLIWLLKNLELY